MTNLSNLDQLRASACADLKLSLELEGARSDDHRRRVRCFTYAMETLVKLQAVLESSDRPSDADLAEFRRTIGSLVAANQRTLYSYINRTFTVSASAIVDGWVAPSIRRSAIQLLLDSFPEAASAFGEEELDLLEEIDEILHDRAQYIEPLPDHRIPAALPDTHWWWRLPSASPEFAARMRMGLE
ncbi:hypothetical protein ACWDSJ_11365 [Nocardia sp. NPDC003482]